MSSSVLSANRLSTADRVRRIRWLMAWSMSSSIVARFGSTPDDLERHQGLTAALVHAGLDVGKITGPLVGGVVAQLVGLAAMFRILPAVLLGLYLVLHFAARRSAPTVVAPAAGAPYTGTNG